MASPAEYLETLARKINDNPQRAGISSGKFQFVLSGEGGGTWTLDVANGKASVQEGPSGGANVTIEMSVADFQEMTAGRLGPVAAYMSGRLRIQGDLGLAMRLQPLLA
ncbi:SCP2 sterol-binding domain-containing protein [Carboxydochorda subterranea]|uniref:SCP2 sterol-binding domain-containing protein n=1 Tax=Carboxydichorda subterranea TaxID=3109565 RepID=A0ABZ1BXQ5_9FIRM|nr:SCP2 sterol-binding domain-containing protein [Limnochorda sp. L945t]WRP17373.1 SCP2 sterol-binding domain-containing protein [Limnochorda sp. L945t]